MNNLFRTLLTLLILGISVAAQVPQSGRVVMVMEENHSYESVIGNSSMPYLNSLAAQYGLATNYYANTHPAIGNNFMLTTGQLVTNDNNFSGSVSANNIVRTALSAGVTWKSYAESLPAIGYTDGDVYPYVKHNNPFAYFSDVRNSSTEKNNIVPFTQFASDLENGTLPQFSFVIPNQQNNTHDCPAGTTTCTEAQKLTAADNWLKRNIAPLLANPDFQNDGLLIITFNEGASTDTNHGGGHVATLVIGPKVKEGYKSTTLYQGQSLLRTVLESVGITSNLPGESSTAPLMSEFFSSQMESAATAQSAAVTPSATTTCTPYWSKPSVRICSPGATSTSPITVTAAAASKYTVYYMDVWIDGVKQYKTYTNYLSTSIALSNGQHTVIVQAKDTSGVKTVAQVTTTVSSTTSTYSLSGTIANGAGSTVTLSGAKSATATADSSGTFTFAGLANGTYTVTPSKTSTTFSPASATITVNGANATGVNFTAATSTSTYSLSGTITNGSGSTVVLSGAKSASTTADSTGKFSFAGLPNGTYTVTPSKTSTTFSPATATVTVNGASISTVNFTATTSTGTAHSASLSWTASTSSGVTGYYVYRSTTSGSGYSKLNSSAVAATSYTDSSVTAGVTYYYVVTALNSSGAESSYSAQASATVPTP